MRVAMIAPIAWRTPLPGLLTLPLVPLAAGMAIVRYRLYDIDPVIDKTLVGGTMVLNSTLALGALVAFTVYINSFFDPIRDLVQIYSNLQRATVAGERIFEVLDTRPDVVDRPDAIELPPVRGEVAFEHVEFSYIEGIPVLRDLNLLRHGIEDTKDIKIKLGELRDELLELRKQWDQWLKDDREHKRRTTETLGEIREAAKQAAENRRALSADELSNILHALAATHRDLAAWVAAGQFRSDLRYRLNVVPIELPPLRERGQDIVLLAQHFLRSGQGSARTLSAPAQARLLAHPWPGNVRELRNVMQRCQVLVRGHGIEAEDLDEALGQAMPLHIAPPLPDTSLPEAVARLERQMIQQALTSSHGNRAEAARRLGIHRQLLYRKLDEYGLQ